MKLSQHATRPEREEIVPLSFAAAIAVVVGYVAVN
jgi:hypothetical protein